jgi:hypothetical protein
LEFLRSRGLLLVPGLVVTGVALVLLRDLRNEPHGYLSLFLFVPLLGFGGILTSLPFLVPPRLVPKWSVLVGGILLVVGGSLLAVPVILVVLSML